MDSDGRIAQLEAEVTALRAEVAYLRQPRAITLSSPSPAPGAAGCGCPQMVNVSQSHYQAFATAGCAPQPMIQTFDWPA